LVPAPPPAPTTPPPAAPQPEPVLKTTETDSGLIIEDLRWGTGEEAQPHQNVTIHYKGTLFDGTVFDSSYARNQPATFNLDQLIKGWREGIPGMKVGSKRRLIIPPDLGYGRKGYTQGKVPIPPDSTLIFEIELLGIQR
jgi:FKBP-type peptidyl-prolyl cis-trans isomerase